MFLSLSIYIMLYISMFHPLFLCFPMKLSKNKTGNCILHIRRRKLSVRLRTPRPRVPRPRVPTSPRPRVPASPRPHVPTSPRPHVPTSPRPSPRVPRPSPRVPRPSPQVPVPLLVTACLWWQISLQK